MVPGSPGEMVASSSGIRRASITETDGQSQELKEDEHLPKSRAEALDAVKFQPGWHQANTLELRVLWNPQVHISQDFPHKFTQRLQFFCPAALLC
jgi:hypothetical protein